MGAVRHTGDMAERATTVQVGERAIKVTNLDKVMYPSSGTTKADVIGYYQAVAPWFVAHSWGRPITRKRWVHGVGTAESPGTSFFEKNLDARSTPDWVPTATLTHSDSVNRYPLANDAATLVWLAQLAALELHTPQWRVTAEGHRQHPDRLVIDLDPGPGTGLPECVELAHLLHEVLAGMGLVCVPVTSGSKGIHVYAGLDGQLSSTEASELARQLAVSLESLRPDLVVANMAKAQRDGKVLIDWSQNNANKTTVAPYSLRGRLRPFVAVPRTWDELAPGLRHLELDELPERLATIGDPLDVLLPPPAQPVAPPGPVTANTGGAAKLADYRAKRDATQTPEPVPAAHAPVTATGGNSFVIQEHHARRLHHDFRLERDGVLVSWALPKLTPLDSGHNHLAVHVEDHPLEYGSFEGTIPKGQYGAGTVEIWDWGHYDAEKWLDREIIVTLQGRPDGGLGGVPRRFALIRTGRTADDPNWLIHLMKTVQPATTPEPTGGSTPQTAAGRQPDELPVIQPMLATAARPDQITGTDWRFETKWDGYRAIVAVAGGQTKWRSRNGLDLTASYPELAELGTLLPGHSAVLDGEIVALDDRGHSNFELLQNHGPTSDPAHFMAFDLLFLDGRSLLRTPYLERRAALEKLLGAGGRQIHVPGVFEGDLELVLAATRSQGAEGIVAKKADSIYQPGRRARTWLKIKHHLTQEVVIVGWNPGSGQRADTIGSLLTGVHDGGRLVYTGRVGSGFSERELAESKSVLDTIGRVTPPVDDVPAADAKGARWVEPLLVGEIKHAGAGKSGVYRHPVWRGWRPDKDPEDVVRED